MSKEERLLWAMLAESERRLASGWSVLDNHEVNAGIRVELRDKFGVNLDTLGERAKAAVSKRLEAVKKKFNEERAQAAKLDELLKKA